MIGIGKKVIIYSMIGIMQFGLGTAVLEASPNQQQYGQHDRSRHNQERQEKQRHERHEREKYRHEQEMRRRRGEGDREWRARQHRENERHDREMRWIIFGILNLILDKE